MSTPRPRPRKVGDLADKVPEGAKIVRPDLTEHTSHGGLYLFDVPGTHTVDGVEYAVK